MNLTRSLIAFLVTLTPVVFAMSADEKAEPVAKQKSLAEANVKAAKLKMTNAETEHLLVYSLTSEEKTKALAANLEKVHTAAAKAMRVSADDKVWTGKLTVYVTNESKLFKGFLLDALKRAPEGRDNYLLELRAEEPFILYGPSPGEKPSETQIGSEVSSLVAAAVLNRKAGPGASTVPEWLLMGFGRAVQMRADSGGTKLSNHKAKVKQIYGKTRGQAFKTMNVWSGQSSAETESIITSFSEFLAYGPYADKFPAFVAAMKPSEDNPRPTPTSAFMTLEWDNAGIEAAWQKYVLTGK